MFEMRHMKLWSSGLCGAVLLLLLGCETIDEKLAPLDEQANEEGLVRVESKAVDVPYRRPEATLSKYTKLMMQPIEVQFAKNWDPDQSGSVLYSMHEPDREKIKSELATVFAEVFKRDMEGGGYPIVTSAGEDVLEMRAAIANLYITAPDPSQTTGRTKVYTTDAGEMTLIMQLHDSVTGQLLARAIDRREADHAFWNWTTSVTNTADAKRIISSWATSLRKAFDASHSGQPMPAAQVSEEETTP
jgi:hypothetical protein